MTVEFLSEKKFKPEEKAMTSLMYLKGNKANLEFLNQSLKVQHIESMVSLEAQMVKNLPAVQETQVRSLGQEDPLEKKMVTHSSILAWEIPWTEEPGGLRSKGLQKVRHNLATKQQQYQY